MVKKYLLFIFPMTLYLFYILVKNNYNSTKKRPLCYIELHYSI